MSSALRLAFLLFALLALPASHAGEPALSGHGSAPARLPNVDQYGDPLPEGVIARLGSGRLRHGHMVQSVDFSPDGTTLFSGSAEGTMRAVDVDTGGVEFSIASRPQ